MPRGFPWIQLLRTFASLITLPLLVAQCPAVGALIALEDTIVSLYQKKSNAVVRVKVATKSLDAKGDPSTSLAIISGFFISNDGKVLTNAIPEQGVVRLWIVKDGTSHIAKLIGTDKRSNISLLQAINLPQSFAVIPLEKPQRQPRIGSFAFAVTSPLDFAPSPSWGLVTGFESQFAKLTFPFTYTRVSIPIGPAEGGSPVFNMDGELLGICVATLPDINSGYIVPTSSIQKIESELHGKGHFSYGFIPIEFEEKSEEKNAKKHVYVKSVNPRSQAEKAGIRAGDIFIASGDLQIGTTNQARDLIFFMQPGSFFPMTVLRDGKEIEFALIIEAQDKEQQPLVTTQPKKGESVN